MHKIDCTCHICLGIMSAEPTRGQVLGLVGLALVAGAVLWWV